MTQLMHRHARSRLSNEARMLAVLDYSRAVAALTTAIPPSTFDRFQYAIRNRSTPAEVLELVHVTWLFYQMRRATYRRRARRSTRWRGARWRVRMGGVGSRGRLVGGSSPGARSREVTGLPAESASAVASPHL